MALSKMDVEFVLITFWILNFQSLTPTEETEYVKSDKRIYILIAAREHNKNTESKIYSIILRVNVGFSDPLSGKLKRFHNKTANIIINRHIRDDINKIFY